MKRIGCIIPYSSIWFGVFLVFVSGFEQFAILHIIVIYFIVKKVCIDN